MATRLRDHFGANRYRSIVGGAGVTVLFRSVAAPGSATPLPINWDDAGTTAVVVLIDRVLANDPGWAQYVRGLAKEAEARRFRTRVFPVAMEEGVLDEISLNEQALRWDRWTDEDSERERRLLRDLTYEFSRMLRHHLTQLRHPDDDEGQLGRYLQKVQVFLSHSKNEGGSVARNIRDWLHEHSALSSFFDVRDIPAGVSFHEVLLHQIKKSSAVLALHTDSYSSREWCRREVIEAKRHHVPMIVVDCLCDLDEHSIPYMGNVPIIRMNPDETDRIDAVIRCLLDEVFKDFLWRCRVERFRATHPNVLFMARLPELISLATLPARRNGGSTTIVHPEPKLGADEARLFREIAPGVRTQTMMEWLENTQ